MAPSFPAAARPILLVDDQASFRRQVSDTLEEAGYLVVAARDGADAMAKLEDGLEPGLVLLDLVLPTMDGWDVLAALRRQRHLAEVPVVVVSGRDAPANLGKVAGFLHKPFELGELLRIVERCCGKPAPGLSTRADR